MEGEGWLQVQCDCTHATKAEVQAVRERLDRIERMLGDMLSHQQQHQQQQDVGDGTLQSTHDMVRHLYYEHNRNEARKRNAAIRRKSPVRFIAEGTSSSAHSTTDKDAALDVSAVYHLLD